MPRMNWAPFTGATYYKVWYGVQGGLYFATPLSGTAELPYAGFTYPGLPLPAGTYKFFIEAFNASRTFPIASSAEWTSRSPARDARQRRLHGPRSLHAHRDMHDACRHADDFLELGCPAPALRGHARERRQLHERDQALQTVFTTLTPRESFLDQQAGQAIYWFVRPCVDAGALALRAGVEHECQCQRVGVPEELRGRRARLATAGQSHLDRRQHRRPDHVQLDRLPRDESGAHPAGRPGGQVLQDRGLARGGLLDDLRHGHGRPDDIHAVQQDLPGGARSTGASRRSTAAATR